VFTQKLSIISSFAALFTCLASCAPRSSASDSIKTLYSFAETPDGRYPQGSLVRDTSGNLYGTTYSGGSKNNGTVFEVSPATGGTWTERILYNFAGGNDGANPTAGLALDQEGNLYGAAVYGGNKACSGGCGTVFRLHPVPNGTWQFSVVHQFKGYDGAYPNQSLTFDGLGGIYGATKNGGTYSYGVIYQLFRPTRNTYEFDVLHDFTGGADGSYPASPTITVGGFIYGVTFGGGKFGKGTAFELLPTLHGPWYSRVIYTFKGLDGANPESPLNSNYSAGFYGLTYAGGAYGFGTAYELAYAAGTGWTENVIYSFTGLADGANPNGPIVSGGSSSLYGTTTQGNNSSGSVFELSPNTSGSWTETTIESFMGMNGGGIGPQNGVVTDNSGNLFGVTQYGGAYGNGTVYEISPSSN
jgi:uncharacterized repeat protein (TIGR03803 family)